MDPAWIGAIGTAGGAVIGGGLVLLGERYRANRERAARLESNRLDAYAAFLAESLLMRSPTEWIAIGSGETLLTRRQAALRAVSTAYARLNLVAGPEVKLAADELAAVVGEDIDQLASTVKRRKPIPDPLSTEREAEFQRLRIAFERAVHEERTRTR